MLVGETSLETLLFILNSHCRVPPFALCERAFIFVFHPSITEPVYGRTLRRAFNQHPRVTARPTVGALCRHTLTSLSFSCCSTQLNWES